MNPDYFILHADTLVGLPDCPSLPLQHAWRIFQRDFSKVFGRNVRLGALQQAQLRIVYAPAAHTLAPEAFCLRFFPTENGPVMELQGADDLGLIYGLLHLSEHYLGVDPFWFWCEQEPAVRSAVAIPCREYHSPPRRVRYRGWFVNDEVCLIGWSDTYPPAASTWLPVFETLLRCGGNLVIPGTDLPRHGVHWQLASDMGLYITHHHAEPLGAEMFLRAHPDTVPSYTQHAGLFEALWQEAIERQREKKVIWTLGFRGQGDCPFWEQDPGCDTPAKRGALISQVIQRQHDLLCAQIENPPCLSYLYGELTELYRQGHLVFPQGVTKIWADNGYGRMVSRRQGNQNQRIPALPDNQDQGPHGLYYHATFHDLQASSHLVMLPVESTLIASELTSAFTGGADHLLLVNCGNIRPHLYTLGLIRDIWLNGSADAGNYPQAFASRYFSAAVDTAERCLRQYFAAAIQYGPHADDKAGDEFYHHPARSLAGHLMRDECSQVADDLRWATGEQTFDGQLQWFLDRSLPALPRLHALLQQCSQLADKLPAEQAEFFRDFLLFQARLHHSGCHGLALLCLGIQAHRSGQHPKAFVRVSQAMWAYQETLTAMRESEHGKWRNFFSADWLTNVQSTLYSLDALRKYIRMFGDNPDYFLWHKTYLMPANERQIYLENTQRRPLEDDELACKLQAHFRLGQNL